MRFLGRVGDVSQHLHASDLLLHPSLSETFGFSLIEAADHGLPVVTLPVPAIDELVPGFVPGTMAGAPTARALADAVQETVQRERPTDEQHAEAWQRRRQRFSARRGRRSWLEELRRGVHRTVRRGERCKLSSAGCSPWVGWPSSPF